MNGDESYRRLFSAIINQAIDDATTYVPEGARLEKKLIPIRAREWFFNPNPMFELACAVTGYEPDAMRDRVRKIIAVAEARHAKGQTRPTRRRLTPGLGQDFQKRAGTGGGSRARDSAKLEFL